MRKLRKLARIRRAFRPAAPRATLDPLSRRSGHFLGGTLGAIPKRFQADGPREGAGTGLALAKDLPTARGQTESRGDLSTWFLRRSTSQTSDAHLHTLELSSMTSN